MAKSSKKVKTINYKLICQECKGVNYYGKHSKSAERKIEANKHCLKCKKHTVHKETKM